MSLLNVTRSRVIQIWFAVVVLGAGAALALGVAVTLGTAALLLAMCLVPPGVVLMMWPADDTSTLAETIEDAKSR